MSVGNAIRELFQGVRWTPSYIAFLYYFFVVTTYWLPGADVAIVIALVLLALDVGSLRIGKVLAAFGGIAGWAWVCYAASPIPAVAFEQTWTLTKLWLVMFVAYNVLRTREQIKFFLAFATGCFLLFPVRGAMLNYVMGITHGGRVAWNYTYSNPNDLAGFAMLFASVALAYLYMARNRFARLMAVASVAVMVLLVFVTQSRGAVVATAVIMTTVMLTRVRRPRMVLGSLAMLAVAAYFAPSGIWQRLGGLANVSVEGGMRGVDEEGSAEQRFQIMRVAARVAADHPITGIGAGTYQYVHAEYARGMTAEAPLAGGRKDAHNSYLTLAAELGVLGLVLFLVQCVLAIRTARQAAKRLLPRDSEVLRALQLGLFAYLLAGMTGSLQYINMLHIHLVLIECTALALLATPLMHANLAPAARPNRSAYRPSRTRLA